MKLRILVLTGLATLLAGAAHAERYTYYPASDADDGHLVDGSTWDDRPSNATVPDLLISLGQEGASTFDNALGFAMPDLVEGQTLADVRLRLNEQGGSIGSGLTVQISAALDLDPLATAPASRFALPRTTATSLWTISASFDSSGQRIAKWDETPDLSAILEEVIAQPGWDASVKEMCLFLELFSASGTNVVRYDDTHAKFAVGGNAGIEPARLVISETYQDAFWGRELLCRPTPTSVTVNIIPHDLTEAYVEWGTDGVTFPNSSGVSFITGGQAKNFVITGLTEDTEYFYRVQSRPLGGSYTASPTRSFVTLPVGGFDSTAEGRLVATTDIHVTNQLALGLDTQMDLLETTMAQMLVQIAPKKYHVWVDLGDLVVIRAQRTIFDEEEAEQRYRTAREYIEQAAHSLPFVLVRGNHEEVNGWDDDATPNNTAIWSGQMLLKYFPPPLPDAFYSGNATAHPILGLPGNYFAFDVASLRVRALDPYLFSLNRPHNRHGQVSGTLDAWDWELGQQQYDWLYDEFDQEPRPYTLTMLHHLTSSYSQPGYYYGRGGVEVVDYSVASRPTFEWGGEDSLGVDVIATMRPGYTHGSIHDMLVSEGNQVVMKGHDHFHGRQTLDGMVYMTMAKPDDTGEHTGDLWGWRYSAFYPDPETLFETNSGFYSIVVNETQTTYEYVQTYPPPGFGTVRDSFTVLPTGATDAPFHGGLASRVTSIRSVSPNPARVAPRIEYELGRSGPVRLAIYDVTGRHVRDLVTDDQVAGIHSVTWDFRDRNGRRVANGAYFARLLTQDRVDSIKLIHLR